MKLQACKLYPDAVAKINKAVQTSLRKTADVVLDDLIQSQTMPMDSGNLQNNSTFVDDSQAAKGVVSIVSDTPYARRLIFHPEYHYNKANNPKAGGEWFEPYLTGTKKDYAQKVFAAFMRSEVK